MRNGWCAVSHATPSSTPRASSVTAPPSTSAGPARRSSSSRAPATTATSSPVNTRPKRTTSKAAATGGASSAARFDNNEAELIELSSLVADIQASVKKLEKAADKDRGNRKLWQDKTTVEMSSLREQAAPAVPRDPSFVPRLATVEGRVETMVTWRGEVDIALRSLRNILAEESDDPDVLTLAERNLPLWQEVGNLYDHTRKIRAELMQRIDDAVDGLDIPAILRRIDVLEQQSRDDDQRIAQLEATVARLSSVHDDYPRPAPPPSFRREQERRRRRSREESDPEGASDDDAHRKKRARRDSPSPPPRHHSPSPPPRRRRRSPSLSDDSDEEDDDRRPTKRDRSDIPSRSRARRTSGSPDGPFYEHSPEYERSLSPVRGRRTPSPAPPGSTLAEAQAGAAAAAAATAAAAARPRQPAPPPPRRYVAPSRPAHRPQTPPPVAGPSSRPHAARTAAADSGPVLGYLGEDDCRTARIGADPKWQRLPWGLDSKGDNGARSRALLEHWWYMVDPTAGIPIPHIKKVDSLHANWRVITFATREEFLLFMTAWQERPESILPVTVVPISNLLPDPSTGESNAAPSNDGIFPSNLPPAFQGPRPSNPAARKGPRESGNGKGKGRADF
ncbi:hypothetical protein EXIGLDRAFT_760946 [Exidia glandulosa HHB12029]|uniref:Uncharacterized protein n=1 Tax=Exidia glandulosa HHB12029 TaxID=1314781 RepID=A0A165NT30_EXIGL|nr:hypothetical protein EXIGLDRAFT_760946 [Exidia glandulosa HHB12029]